MSELVAAALKSADIRKRIIELGIAEENRTELSVLLNEFEIEATHLRGQTLEQYITSMGGNGNIRFAEICRLVAHCTPILDDKVCRQFALLALDSQREERHLDLVLNIRYGSESGKILASGLGVRLA